MTSPREVYLERRAGAQSGLREAERRSHALARLRLLAFAVAIGLLVAAIDDRLHPGWIGVPLLAFGALVVVHERVHRRIDRARRAIAEHDAGLRRIDGSWPGHGNQRTDLADADHPYARDLDLFGTGSVFELLCTARTAAGEQILASWLLGPAIADAIAQRHAALDELRERARLREDLA
ncbi:MAG: DNA mismatch repair protein MutS, partial [Deltaproteobacteria bacterium]|nr:DNA mismatch repair protein MutS [Nannocystaceae bacterium]